MSVCVLSSLLQVEVPLVVLCSQKNYNFFPSSDSIHNVLACYDHYVHHIVSRIDSLDAFGCLFKEPGTTSGLTAENDHAGVSLGEELVESLREVSSVYTAASEERGKKRTCLTQTRQSRLPHSPKEPLNASVTVSKSFVFRTKLSAVKDLSPSHGRSLMWEMVQS